MSRLEILLLGPPQITLNGAAIEVDTRKATALLAYLAVTGESHTRDALATMLWPDNDQAGARAALRRTLSTLNKALDGEWLDVERESLGLSRGGGFSLDVDEFRRLLAERQSHGHPPAEVCARCRAPLSAAAALYRDDFLAGFSLRDSPGFDDWQFFQAEGLRRELAGALERLARCHEANADYEAAVAAARRWLALDSLHEPAHRALMQLYARSGQRAAALRQYRECVRVLEKELSVAPLEETTRLYEAIKEGRGAGGNEQRDREALSPAHLPTRTPAGSLPLVGREAEWKELLKAYAASSHDGHLIILEGEAGIGKTRLAEALLHYARSAGGRVVVARCYEGESQLAYAPFVSGLRAALTGQSSWREQVSPRALSEAARLLPELADLQPDLPTATPLNTPGAQLRLFDAVCEILLAVCSPKAASRSQLSPGSVILLDDLHWADEASVELLTYLVRRIKGRRVLILGAWRGEDVPPDHRLRRLVASAQRSGAGTLVTLPRLDREAVLELVTSAFSPTAAQATWHGGYSAASLADRLFRESEGLPFFVVEYLSRITDQAEWTIPASVRALVQSRLSAVSQTGWQLLTAAAVIGRSFDFDTLRGASGRSEEETVAALEELIAKRIVEEARGKDGGGPRYDFNHEKLREVVYDGTTLARRRLLHRRVAEAIAQRVRARPVGPRAGQIAEHYRLAGRDAEAAEHFKLAGDYARSLYANAEARKHYASALALGHPQVAALHESIGDLQTLAGDYGGALQSYEAAAALCSPEELRGVERKLGGVYHRRGNWDLAEAHFQSASKTLGEPAEPNQASRLYADWSLTAHHRGEAERALGLAQSAMEMAQAGGDRRALAQAHNHLGILASSRREFEEARHHLEESLGLAQALGDVSAQVAALNNLALALRASGDLGKATAFTEQALALCVSQGDRHREAALHNNLADLHHATGRGDDAMAHLRQAVSIFAEIGVEGATLLPEIWKLVEW